VYQHERATADNGVAVVSHVRVHAEGIAARLSDVEGLGTITSFRAEDCSPTQLQRQNLAVMLVDSSSVRARVLANTLGLTASITLASLTLRLVVYGLAHGDDETVLDFAALGARGFAFSDATFAELSDTVIRVLEGHIRCPRKVAAALLDHFSSAARVRGRFDVLNVLTPRQREAVILRLAGESNKLVAHRMGVELGTVKREIHDAYRKLEVRGIQELAQLLDRDDSRSAFKGSDTSS
jgi:DNA-binding NarL/FixJ family response regulator